MEKTEPKVQGAEEQHVRLHVDERDLNTSYVNAFRTHASAEEVILDLGLNMLAPAPKDPKKAEIIFHVTDRVILNYYSAKRLAVTLGKVVRQHEEQFGELETDPAKRRRSTGG